MKTLVTAFQQTTAGARTAGRAFPPAAVFLIFGRACRILVRAHGRVAPGKLMPWRGLASSPGSSRSGSVRTQDSIAEGTGAARLCPWFAFSRLRRRGCQVGQSEPLLPCRFPGSAPRAPISASPRVTTPGLLSETSSRVGLRRPPAIISLPPGAASTAEMVHSLTASNTNGCNRPVAVALAASERGYGIRFRTWLACPGAYYPATLGCRTRRNVNAIWKPSPRIPLIA